MCSVAADLNRLADKVENNNSTDFVTFRLNRIRHDLAQILDVRGHEVDVVLVGLQEAAPELHFCSVREEEQANFGRLRYNISPHVIEARFIVGWRSMKNQPPDM